MRIRRLATTVAAAVVMTAGGVTAAAPAQAEAPCEGAHVQVLSVGPVGGGTCLPDLNTGVLCVPVGFQAPPITSFDVLVCSYL